MDNRPILITGTHGFVGSRALIHFRDAVAVPGPVLRGSPQGLTDFIREKAPRAIIHTAAISSIPACAQDPQASYQANVMLPLSLARLSREMGAKLVAFSSDQVYTGCVSEGPYKESDPLPTPANVYACHKLEMENRVLDMLPEAVLLRATWMYDMPLFDHDNRGNFLVNCLKAIMQGERMRFSARDHRAVTYVRQVVALLEQTLTLPGGVYNYGSENPLSMLDTARALLAALGLAEREEELLEESPRCGHPLWMDCRKLRDRGAAFDTTEEGLYRCVLDYGLRL